MQAGHIRQSVLPGAVHSQAEQDETQLVKASQQGDLDAFALLVRRHQRRIFNLSLGLLQDEDDASASAQAAFVAAWQGLPGFRGETGFPTWLYRIAYRCCLQQLERRKREHARRSAIQVEQVLVERSTEKQTAEALERHDLQALVREQMEHLPLKYRAVFILRHLHDKTYEEIAAILSIPRGTVKIHLFRARMLLQERVLAQHLVTRKTVLGTSLTENENVMHTSGQFHVHGRGQDSSAVNQETEDFSQQQNAWVEQQQNWVEQQHSALAQQDAWLKQRRGWLEQQQGWLEQQQGWLEQRRAWLAERRSWIEQRRGWVVQQDEKMTQQQEVWLIQQEAWLDQQYTALVQQVSELVQQSQWMSQRRSWLDRKPRQFTQQDRALTQGDESEERRLG